MMKNMMTVDIKYNKGDRKMKKLKRVITTLLITTLLCSCFSMVAFAASAQFRFSDPSTTVGAEVEVTATFTSESSVQSMDATLTFDTNMLRFIEGGNARVEGGTITLSGAGDGMSTEISHTLKFQALAEGTTVIEVASSTGVTTSGTEIEVTNGSSTITIGPGDPSLIKSDAMGDGPQVEVNGTKYVISSDFSEALIPEGFVKSETQYEGTACSVVTQESSGTMAMYLKSDAGDEDFFLYDPDKGVFSPFEEVEIAKGRYLIFLEDDGTVSVPSGYEKTSITIEGSGKEFPAWQNTKNAEYYLVYCLNSDGTKALYLHDTVDGTYQRYLKSTAIDVSNGAEPEGILGKALQFVGDNLKLCALMVCAAILLLLLILIVVAIKLRHRNLELDDLYDEYGIDLDDEEDVKPSKKDKKDKKSKAVSKKKKKDEDDFYDFDDEDSEYDDYEDDDDAYDDDDYELDDYEDESDDDAFEAYDYDMTDYSGDDSDIEDLDALLNARVREPAKRPKKTEMRSAGHSDPDDTFKMDIIDLD